jgi:hypothetical protein
MNIFKKLAGGIILNEVVEVGDHTEFTGPAIAPVVEFVVDDNAGRHAGADDQADHIGIGFSFAEIFFAQGKTIGVIVNKNR